MTELVECNAQTEPDSFGVFLVCDAQAGHDGKHHAWLIGNREMTEWSWAEGEL